MSEKPIPKNKNLYLRILGYLKPYYMHIIGVMICNFGFVISSMLTVWMVAPVISVIFQNFDDGKGHVLQNGQPLAVCDKTAAALANLGRDDTFISESTYFYDGGGCC